MAVRNSAKTNNSGVIVKNNIIKIGQSVNRLPSHVSVRTLQTRFALTDNEATILG